MIRVETPKTSVNSTDFFSSCVDKTNPLIKRKRLQDSKNDIETAISDYKSKANLKRLDEIEAPRSQFSTANVEDLYSLYDSFMTPKSSCGRVHYDMIMNAAACSICPLCGIGSVENLDHFLPRSIYPQFSIAFENLVPICRDCNTAKLNQAPRSSAEVFFHPYYESCSSHQWLKATIDDRDSVTFSFSVPPSIPSSPENERLQNQFNLLRLSRRYAIRAASEFREAKDLLRDMFNAAGRMMLHGHLLNIAKSAESSPFSAWKVAMYQAMASDDWFTGGGFI